MTEHDDLIREFSTPLEDLDPETRARIERSREWAAQQRADGKVAPASNAQRHPDPIGLDDNFEPFPVRSQPSAEPEPPDHD